MYFCAVKKKQLLLFASGSGSNAERIMAYFAHHPTIGVAAVIYNRKDAGVVEKAERFHVDTQYFSNEDFISGERIVSYCNAKKADLLVLAGFLRKIPAVLLKAYPNRILNIHPALLPNYGGKGMYGHFVHEKVSENGDTKSGMTVHLVNEQYDEGAILAQYSCKIKAHENPTVIASEVLKLEHLHYAPTIENYIQTL